MTNYKCDGCGYTIEIEDYEATFGHHEHYEHGRCKECFDKMNNEEE